MPRRTLQQLRDALIANLQMARGGRLLVAQKHRDLGNHSDASLCEAEAYAFFQSIALIKSEFAAEEVDPVLLERSKRRWSHETSGGGKTFKPSDR